MVESIVHGRVHRPWSSRSANRWEDITGERERGTRHASRVFMIAKNLDDVLVYRKATEAEDAVSDILERCSFGEDFNLKDQLERSSSRVPALISEGFGQTTDRHVATYYGRARGSSMETTTHLRKAFRKRFISQKEFTELTERYVVIGKMLSRWMHYLRRCDWKDRG